jgi:pimeloyl-ACP methyl ester carboxylesterase
MKKFIIKATGIYLNILCAISKKTGGEKGFFIFCNPFRTSLKPYQQSFLQTGIYDVIPFEEYTLQTYKWGNGSKHVLLAHGWASHSFRWKAYIEYLITQDYTVYAFDAPGHGLSGGKYLHLLKYSNAIEAVLNSFTTIDKIIGHSFGCFATLYLMFNNKNIKINKLALMATPGEAVDFFSFYKGTLQLNSTAMNCIISEFVQRLGHPPAYFSIPSFVKDNKAACLIVHDENDKETPYRNAVALHKAYAGSKLITTKNLGHGLKSDDVMKEVVEFIN